MKLGKESQVSRISSGYSPLAQNQKAIGKSLRENPQGAQKGRTSGRLGLVKLVVPIAEKICDGTLNEIFLRYPSLIHKARHVSLTKSQLPWWTWIAPFLVCQVGDFVSLRLQLTPGIALLHGCIPLAIAMIYWWGPRVLLGLAISAAITTGLWGLSDDLFWQVRALSDSLTVFSSWVFFAFLFREPLNLTDGRQTLKWLVTALLPGAVMDGIQILGHSVLLGEFPTANLWDRVWAQSTGTLLGGLVIATPLVYFVSPWLEKRGLARTQSSPFPNWIAAQGRRRFLPLEMTLIFALPALVSRYFPLSDYWIAFATIGLWVALRFSLSLVLTWNIWTVVFALTMPLLWPVKGGSGVTEISQLIHMHLGLAFLCAVTLIIGSAFHVMMREIEARRRSEASLLLTRFTVEHSSEAMFRMNAKGRIVDVNESACASLGYTREEMLSLSIPDIDPFFPMEHWENSLQSLSQSGINKIEAVHRTKDGTLKPVEIVANYLKFGDDEMICSFVRDISDRNAARERLSQSEARFRSLVENAPDVIVVYDMNQGRFVDFNEKACRFFRLSREELLQKSPMDLSPERQPNGRLSSDMVMEKLNLAKEGQAQQFEWTHKNSQGEEMVCDLRLSLFPSSEGLLIRGSILDISERKRLESELHKTQKLESLGILAGGIAHDFNNLIGGIYGYIDMAQSRPLDAKVAHYLASATRSIERARGLTQQLLTFARGGEPIKRPQSLAPFIQETTRFALSGSDVDCQFQISEDLWICEFDRNQIGQVIDNLVINAMQAMPRGGNITVSAENIPVGKPIHPSLEPGNFVCISIRDQGEGISQAILPRIFDPFFTTKAKGHGLGLATCFSIVSRHGGHIDVESEVGKGTVFHIYLPSTEKIIAQVAIPATTDFEGKGFFILMDDDANIRESIGSMLSDIGYEVLVTENGQEAIEALQSLMSQGKEVAAMLFDLTVPGQMGGREAVVRVKAIQPSIPVFVASGYAEDPVMARPKDFGFEGSICKPFLKSELIQMLRLQLYSPAQ